jgi:glutathione S-transferase
MLQLYFYPMACSLSSRIALMEAGIEARYRPAHIWKKTVLDDDSNFLAVSSKGAVPVLVLENGERLTEAAAVLQYIADLRPETRLAPPSGDLDRYRLQEWLSFVGTEIHKAFLFPTFWYKDDASKASARKRIGQTVSVAATHLSNRDYLIGDRFTVADAHLIWSLPRRRRSRPMAPACHLSRPHPSASAGQGGGRDRDGVTQDGRGVIARKPWWHRHHWFAQPDCPTGKSVLFYGSDCQAQNFPGSKIFLFYRIPNQRYIHTHPVPTRGTYHDRHDRGAGRGGRWQCR